MRVFISWSGEKSRKVAELLDWWIQSVIQAVDPWISTTGIDSGSLWFNEINDKLSDTQHGIVCLSRENLNSPWILFESGALFKGMESSRLYTFLIDLDYVDIKDPLRQFNHTKPTKTDVWILIQSINNALGNNALSEKALGKAFETYWPQFEQAFDRIMDEHSTDEQAVVERSDSELLEEVLLLVRGIDKNLSRSTFKPYGDSSSLKLPGNPQQRGLLTLLDNTGFFPSLSPEFLEELREEPHTNDDTTDDKPS